MKVEKVSKIDLISYLTEFETPFNTIPHCDGLHFTVNCCVCSVLLQSLNICSTVNCTLF